MSLLVSEIYGCFQGEGPSTGRVAVLLRLHGCNLACSWCDTPWTWDEKRADPARPGTELSIDGVRAGINSVSRSALVVISGGEPLLQADDVLGLILALPAERPVEIETNGTRPAPEWAGLCMWNVSPKLANSGRVSRLHPSWRDEPTARFKFVVTDVVDVVRVAAMALPAARVWVMPEGTEAQRVLDVARDVAPVVAASGFNLTLRQHVLLYGNESRR